MPKTKTTGKLVDQLFVTNIEMLPIVYSSAGIFRGHVQRKECDFGAHHVIEYLDIQKTIIYICMYIKI
jgi:hypothetical protein